MKVRDYREENGFHSTLRVRIEYLLIFVTEQNVLWEQGSSVKSSIS